ncbi:hypothetical protein OOK27_13015 [Streptomyces canus]|uniref:hypothetical protein n=1 Tax=Streptomyces canus TaxID=58343 RepID=UPI002255B0AD|nr:hypothetical protein [Streptomyces canus]MCX5255064.1 hypothetical protein [Streptomyces canus]
MTNDPDAPLLTCSCLPSWPALTAVIEGTTYTAAPAPAYTPASALYLARCAGCGALYTHPWRRTSPSTHAA